MKNLMVFIAIIAVLIGGIYWSRSLQSKDPNILSANGLHWHPTLEIVVKGEKQVIPANLGIGPQYSSLPMGMTPVHTHDDASQGIVHLEFNGVVRKEDTKLGKFFEIWDKSINSFGDTFTMTVNGEQNADLENYEMKDGDKIVISYE